MCLACSAWSSEPLCPACRADLRAASAQRVEAPDGPGLLVSPAYAMILVIVALSPLQLDPAMSLLSGITGTLGYLGIVLVVILSTEDPGPHPQAMYFTLTIMLAVATAATALSHGSLDLAIVGGVDISLDTFELIGFAKTKALTRDDMRVYDQRGTLSPKLRATGYKTVFVGKYHNLLRERYPGRKRMRTLADDWNQLDVLAREKLNIQNQINQLFAEWEAIEVELDALRTE